MFAEYLGSFGREDFARSVGCDFLYRARQEPQSGDVSQSRLVGFIKKLIEDWYLQEQQLDSCGEIVDAGE